MISAMQELSSLCGPAAASLVAASSARTRVEVFLSARFSLSQNELCQDPRGGVPECPLLSHTKGSLEFTQRKSAQCNWLKCFKIHYLRQWKKLEGGNSVPRLPTFSWF